MSRAVIRLIYLKAKEGLSSLEQQELIALESLLNSKLEELETRNAILVEKGETIPELSESIDILRQILLTNNTVQKLA